jgi:hypothetical protein
MPLRRGTAGEVRGVFVGGGRAARRTCFHHVGKDDSRRARLSFNAVDGNAPTPESAVVDESVALGEKLADVLRWRVYDSQRFVFEGLLVARHNGS